MGINIHVDKENRRLTIKKGEQTMLLEQGEAIQLLKGINDVRSTYGFLFNPFHHRIPLDEWIDHEMEGKRLVGINFSGEKMLRLGHSNFYAEFVTEDGKTPNTRTNVEDNFTKGDLWEGSVTNFELRNCLSDELVHLFKENPDLYLSFNGINITTEVIFDEDERIFVFDESFDS